MRRAEIREETHYVVDMYDEKDDLGMSNVFFIEPVPLSRWGRRRIINPFAPRTANMSTEVATTPADPSPAGTTLTRRSLSLPRERERGCRGWLSVWFRPDVFVILV